MDALKTENQRLKDENGALIRVISKLSKWSKQKLKLKQKKNSCELRASQFTVESDEGSQIGAYPTQSSFFSVLELDYLVFKYFSFSKASSSVFL